MEFKGTVERLMGLLSVQNDLFYRNAGILQIEALDRLIAKQVDRVKVNVMTHILDGMDFFNRAPEFETCTVCGITAADVHERADAYANDVHNDPDAVHTVCDECDYQNRMDI